MVKVEGTLLYDRRHRVHHQLCSVPWLQDVRRRRNKAAASPVVGVTPGLYLEVEHLTDVRLSGKGIPQYR